MAGESGAEPRRGAPFTVHHDKPWRRGKPIRMRGTVVSADGETVVLARAFRHPGQPYDGLFATQRAGDHGTITLRQGAWVCRRRYLRGDGTLIGELYNVQTPTRFEPHGARYVDLEVDVALLPHRPQPVEVQDRAELERARQRGHIPGPVAELALWVAEELARRLQAWDGRGEPDWDVRPAPAQLTPEVERFLPRE